LRSQWLVASVAAGIAADLAIRRFPWNSLATAILVAVLAAGLAASGYLRSRSSQALAVAAVVFGAFLVIHTEPILSTFNFLIAFGLLCLAAAQGQGRPFWDFGPGRLLMVAMTVLVEALVGLVEVPAEAQAQARAFKERADGGRAGTGYAIARGLALAVPLVIVLIVLLASADAVFQSIISLDQTGLNAGSIIGHLFLIAFGAYGCMVLLRLAHLEGGSRYEPRVPTLGPIESGVILGGVNLVFALFAVAQVLTISGGADAALERAGLDPKEFARQGFFQLLVTAGIILVVLLVLRRSAEPSPSSTRVVRVLAPVTVVLTLLIVVVAVTRIGFYVDDGGLTPLRFYAIVASLWVAAAFLAVAVRVAGIAEQRQWMVPVLLVLGLSTVGVLNVINPETIIARENLSRSDDALFWHLEYGQYHRQGEAVLVDGLDRLDPELRDRVTKQLCRGWSLNGRNSAEPDLLSYNRGRAEGRQALSELC
jgi:hypothetical protein